MAEKIRGYYEKGYYKKRHLLAFYTAGVISAAEYEEITGETI